MEGCLYITPIRIFDLFELFELKLILIQIFYKYLDHHEVHKISDLHEMQRSIPPADEPVGVDSTA